MAKQRPQTRGISAVPCVGGGILTSRVPRKPRFARVESGEVG